MSDEALAPSVQEQPVSGAVEDDALPLIWPETGLRPHKFASIFRMLQGDEKEAFDADVAEHGLREPIVVYENAILDGRNRYLAIIECGEFEPDEDWRDASSFFTEFEGTIEDAFEFVWSLNDQRRHDNASQRAFSAARYANLRKVTQAEAAQKFDVSERQVNSVQAVLEHGEQELQDAVEDGRVPAYLAEQLVTLPPEDQREVAAKPKREASAKAREKLAPKPAEPMITPRDPNLFVLFSEAVLRVASENKRVSHEVLTALAAQHDLLADGDGTFLLNRESRLAADTARRKLGLAEGAMLRDAALVVATAGMSDSIEDLIGLYKRAIVEFDRATTAGEAEKAMHAQLAMEAVLFKANGLTGFGALVNEAPQAIRRSVTPPAGTVPMWGQAGCFRVELNGVAAIIEIEDSLDLGYYHLHATTFDQPFPTGNAASYGYLCHVGRTNRFSGMSFAEAGKAMLREAHEKIEGKPQFTGEAVGLFYPETIARISEIGVVLVPRGVELVPGAWPYTLLEDHFRSECRKWQSDTVSGQRKKAFPKPKHLATHIWSLGETGSVPLADFPLNGRYLTENNGTWRYVDDGTDPGADAVQARMQGAVVNPATHESNVALADAIVGALEQLENTGAGTTALLAAYNDALAALTEPKGKLHQSSAADALRAGVAANVPRAQMAADLGHPIGTIKAWTARLGLTDAARLQDTARVMNELNRSRKGEPS